jgi:hypothetical protein
MDDATRRTVNDEQLRRYLHGIDPAWRWILLLGLRDLRCKGVLAPSLTALAVAETCQHVEDLLALISFIAEPFAFVQRMVSYRAGAVRAGRPAGRGAR